MGKIVNGITIPIFLIGAIITGIYGYGKLNNQVESNEKKIMKLEELPVKMAAVQTDVTYIKTEQRIIKEDIKEILRAVR